MATSYCRMLPRDRLLFVGLAGTAFLAAFFFMVLRREDATLGTPVVDMGILPAARWSDVRYTRGTLLQGNLGSQTLRPAQSPYLLQGSVRVPAGARLWVEPDTLVAASEGARIVVEGTLEVHRAAFVSNQLHLDRRLWHGLTVQRGGKIVLRESTISNASAGLTCAEGGTVSVSGGGVIDTAAGFVTLQGCATAQIDRVQITQSRVGFYLLGGSPVVTNAILTRVFDGFRVFHEARPTIVGLTVRTPRHAVVMHAASTDLPIRGLVLPRGADRAALIIDGTDAPTHRWRDREYPTGRVIVQ
ncbi:MAG: hypothetical protein G01um101438_607 [Parcubacteria group bacterium Gr01-1014_38]|nr:MAG: hypothetical protein G01um101438_607 [Parcubacteria group bacterium Gr01-1014_38]